MSMKTYKNFAATSKSTPQSKAIPGRESEMVKNNAGGFVFEMDIWGQLNRFLILGTEGGTYYVGEQKLTENNAKNVIKCIKADGVRVVQTIVEVSQSGRAPKNDPALFALALVLTYGDTTAKKAATEAITKVARIGTHVLHLAAFLKDMRGNGRAIRNAFANWYNSKTPVKMAEQVLKYANRDGWTHKDIIRLNHIRPATVNHDIVFKTIFERDDEIVGIEYSDELAEYLSAVTKLKATNDIKTAIKLIEEYKLPREMIGDTKLLNDRRIWEALLPHMGMEAMVRNLGTMTNNGLISRFSDAEKHIVSILEDKEAISKSKIHPMKLLLALKTYSMGRGFRGSNVWTPNQSIIDALDEAFYLAFGNVTPTGKNFVLAIDVSGSMSSPIMNTNISCREAAMALALITARTEKFCEITAFGTDMIPVDITKKDRLSDAMRKTDYLPWAGTDCAKPMEWALKKKINADAFVMFTDNETWAGNQAPSQALTKFRKGMGIDAKMVVNGMTSTGFSIADSSDRGSLDVVGFDSATPTVISDFVRGDI